MKTMFLLLLSICFIVGCVDSDPKHQSPKRKSGADIISRMRRPIIVIASSGKAGKDTWDSEWLMVKDADGKCEPIYNYMMARNYEKGDTLK